MLGNVRFFGSPLSVLARIARRNVFRNPRRSILTLLAVIAGVGSSVALAALARGMAKQMVDDAIHSLTGHIQIHASGYLDDPVIDLRIERPGYPLMRELASKEIEGWVERVRVPAVVMSERESAGVTLVGIDPKDEQGLSLAGDPPFMGRQLTSVEDGGVIIGEELLSELETGLGKRIVVMSQNIHGTIAERGFRIVGVFQAELASTEKSFIFTGRATAQTLLGVGNEISEISIIVKDENKVDSILEKLSKIVPSLSVTHWMELEPLLVAMTSIQDGFLILWFAVVMVAVGFGLVNTIFMGIFERTRELAVMQAIGLRPSGVIGEIVLGSVFLLLVGAVIGTGFGYGIVWLLQGGIDISAFAQGADVIGMGHRVFPHVMARDVIVVNLLILIIGSLGSLYPAWHASGKGLSAARALG